MGTYIKLTEEQSKELIQLYSDKIPIKILAKKYNCCATTLSKLLKLNGVTPTKCGYSNVKKFSREKEMEIISLYKKGLNQVEIAKRFNTFNTSIRRVLLRNNLIPRSNKRVNRMCKHNPFHSYKKHDEYTEYFLGLLLTDGCISCNKKSKRTPNINIALTDSDGYIIEAFKNWASPKQKVSRIYQKLNSSYMASINICNEETVEWLNKKGNFRNKSYECKIYCPITWTILRGIFDGDGGWKIANKEGLNFFICGLSKTFIYQIHNFLKKQGINSRIKFLEPCKYHKNGLYYVEVYNYSDVSKIGINMYSNAHIFIKRKYERWLAFYENKGKNYTLNSGKEMAIQP